MDVVTQLSRKSKHSKAAATAPFWERGHNPGRGFAKCGGPRCLMSLVKMIRKLPKSLESSLHACAGWGDLGNSEHPIIQFKGKI